METSVQINSLGISREVKQVLSRTFESLHLDGTAQLQILSSLRSLIIEPEYYRGDYSTIVIQLHTNIRCILDREELADRALMLILALINSKIREITESTSRAKHKKMGIALRKYEF